MDTDYAAETANLIGRERHKILQQAATSILAQDTDYAATRNYSQF